MLSKKGAELVPCKTLVYSLEKPGPGRECDSRAGDNRAEALEPHPGRVGLVELVQHDDRGAPVVIDQPPEVRGGTLQWMQGHNEGGAPCVALQRKRQGTALSRTL